MKKLNNVKTLWIALFVLATLIASAPVMAACTTCSPTCDGEPIDREGSDNGDNWKSTHTKSNGANTKTYAMGDGDDVVEVKDGTTGQGRDNICGDGDDDALFGGDGGDFLDGGDHNDYCNGGKGQDTCNCESGSC